jgi:hypothetical protein
VKTNLRYESTRREFIRRASLTIAGGALRSEDETVTIPGNPLANWGMSDRDREHAVARDVDSFMY